MARWSAITRAEVAALIDARLAELPAIDPDVPPLPSCRVPAVIVVTPL